jgi:hypothetical protein
MPASSAVRHHSLDCAAKDRAVLSSTPPKAASLICDTAVWPGWPEIVVGLLMLGVLGVWRHPSDHSHHGPGKRVLMAVGRHSKVPTLAAKTETLANRIAPSVRNAIRWLIPSTT